MSLAFWFNDPKVLLDKQHIFDLYPTENMAFEQKLNAITRLVILLSILGYLITMNKNILLMCIITLIAIYIIYRNHKQKILAEGFKVEPSEDLSKNKNTNVSLKSVLKDNFYPISKKNPMGNVLLTEIMDDPERPPAAPSFNPEVYSDINNATKKAVQMMNPSIDNARKQLYGDLGSNYDFDWSMRNFYSMPNTRVTNDQGAYSKYLYGLMPSGKGSDAISAMQREKDNYRYILI
jgi:Family of unknown function (DUF5762)